VFLQQLVTRKLQPEIMDQPDLPAEQHWQALAGLARINWISASAGILWRPIRRLALENPGRPLRVLDVATGGGDVLLRLHQRARDAGLPFEFTGIDISETALEVARSCARRQGAAIHFDRLNVVEQALPTDHDVVVSSLFLHHLERTEAVELLRRMGQATRGLVLVNDLIRTRLGYALAWLGTRTLTRSKVVHVDGLLSVQAAFTIPEARLLADEAGLIGASVSWRWPFRFLLQWRKPA
jgi:2-polyprenyl-3-methyl-5-hydroxy-6-metoxy-1,4-benzoquinol methylase